MSAAPSARRGKSAFCALCCKFTLASSKLVVDRAPLTWKVRYRHSGAARRDGTLESKWRRQSDGKKQAAPKKRRKKRKHFSRLLSSLRVPSSQLTCSPFLKLARATTRATGRAVVDGRVEKERIAERKKMRGHEKEREKASEKESNRNTIGSLSCCRSLFHAFNVPAPLRVEPARPRTGRVEARAMVIEGEVRRKKQKRKERRSEEFYSKKFEEESRVETSFFFSLGRLQLSLSAHKKKQIKQRERGGPQLAPPFKALSSSPIASSNHRQVAAATEAGARGRERPLLGRERDDKGSVFFLQPKDTDGSSGERDC